MPVMKVYNATTSQWEDVGAGGLTNPMTAAGDIIYGGASGAPTRLAKGTDGQVLTLASGLPAWGGSGGGFDPLVAEYIVTGSARTEVTFSDLDGDTDGGYELCYVVKNAVASPSALNLYINGDTNPANYNYRTIYTTASTYSQTAGAEGGNSAITSVGYMPAGDCTSVSVVISAGLPIVHCNADVVISTTQINKTALIRKVSANVTSLTVTASVASSIGVGSTFRLYKRK